MHRRSEICTAAPKYIWPRRNMHCHAEICIATLKYALPLWNMQCHSEICNATPKYAMPLRNMHCHFKICIATPKYALPLRNMHCHSEICPKPARKKPLFPWNFTYSPTAYLYSDICFATPKYAIATPKKTANPLKMYILTHSVPIKHSKFGMQLLQDGDNELGREGFDWTTLNVIIKARKVKFGSFSHMYCIM